MGGLEVAFSSMIQEHAQRNLHLKERAEKAKKDALAAAILVSDLLVDSLNKGVQESFVIEKHIEMEVQTLAGTVQKFAKQTNQWLTVVHNFDNALKEIGDFENWIKVMECECESIWNAMEHLSLVSGRIPFK
eukprot:c27070_g1_i1 orf=190-585(+)